MTEGPLIVEMLSAVEVKTDRNTLCVGKAPHHHLPCKLRSIDFGQILLHILFLQAYMPLPPLVPILTSP